MVQDNNPKYKLDNNENKQIGQKLKSRRKFLKMTQANLASKIGCTFQQIQKYESGINNISLNVLLKLCEVLKCNPNYFFSNFGLSDSISNNNCDNDMKTNMQLDNTELQIILRLRQINSNNIKNSIVNLLQNIIDLQHQ
ncbi:MAG: helix-turn-helix transcriptional regulator [Alphaproteobacteria bacterium]|nr:helix-turn-helix transcriptional regulator [Alphaproteobacteria bacterium]